MKTIIVLASISIVLATSLTAQAGPIAPSKPETTKPAPSPKPEPSPKPAIAAAAAAPQLSATATTNKVTNAGTSTKKPINNSGSKPSSNRAINLTGARSLEQTKNQNNDGKGTIKANLQFGTSSRTGGANSATAQYTGSAPDSTAPSSFQFSLPQIAFPQIGFTQTNPLSPTTFTLRRSSNGKPTRPLIVDHHDVSVSVNTNNVTAKPKTITPPTSASIAATSSTVSKKPTPLPVARSNKVTAGTTSTVAQPSAKKPATSVGLQIPAPVVAIQQSNSPTSSSNIKASFGARQSPVGFATNYNPSATAPFGSYRLYGPVNVPTTTLSTSYVPVTVPSVAYRPTYGYAPISGSVPSAAYQPSSLGQSSFQFGPIGGGAPNLQANNQFGGFDGGFSQTIVNNTIEVQASDDDDDDDDEDDDHDATTLKPKLTEATQTSSTVVASTGSASSPATSSASSAATTSTSTSSVTKKPSLTDLIGLAIKAAKTTTSAPSSTSTATATSTLATTATTDGIASDPSNSAAATASSQSSATTTTTTSDNNQQLLSPYNVLPSGINLSITSSTPSSIPIGTVTGSDTSSTSTSTSSSTSSSTIGGDIGSSATGSADVDSSTSVPRQDVLKSPSASDDEVHGSLLQVPDNAQPLLKDIDATINVGANLLTGSSLDTRPIGNQIENPFFRLDPATNSILKAADQTVDATADASLGTHFEEPSKSSPLPPSETPGVVAPTILGRNIDPSVSSIAQQQSVTTSSNSESSTSVGNSFSDSSATGSSTIGIGTSANVGPQVDILSGGLIPTLSSISLPIPNPFATDSSIATSTATATTSNTDDLTQQVASSDVSLDTSEVDLVSADTVSLVDPNQQQQEAITQTSSSSSSSTSTSTSEIVADQTVATESLDLCGSSLKDLGETVTEISLQLDSISYVSTKKQRKSKQRYLVAKCKSQIGAIQQSLSSNQLNNMQDLLTSFIADLQYMTNDKEIVCQSGDLNYSLETLLEIFVNWQDVCSGQLFVLPAPKISTGSAEQTSASATATATTTTTTSINGNSNNIAESCSVILNQCQGQLASLMLQLSGLFEKAKYSGNYQMASTISTLRSIVYEFSLAIKLNNLSVMNILIDPLEAKLEQCQAYPEIDSPKTLALIEQILALIDKYEFGCIHYVN